MHVIAELDFMGSAPGTAASHFPSVYLALTAVLAVAAVAGRKRQLHSWHPASGPSKLSYHDIRLKSIWHNDRNRIELQALVMFFSFGGFNAFQQASRISMGTSAG
jgi:hypothetical protein